ncbi:MAG TPA: hypothetical protein VKT21_07340 [Thermoplasmata archaeon]|nr:hypothetical protein [Thermoplasmata archaeon]
MTGQCAICDGEVHDGVAHCTACGFPMAMTDLAARLIEELPEPEALVRPRPMGSDAPSRARARERPGIAGTRDPQVEVVNRIARDVSHAVALLQDLGGDGGDIANELAQAAFTQAEGRVGEVLVLLRDAQGRVSIRLKEQFDSRLKQLEERQAAMIASGVSVNLGGEIDRVRIDVRAGRREAALHRIDQADQSLSRIESDWRGLQGLLRQIEGLRESARLLELDVGEPDDSLRQVRVILAQPSLEAGSLDHAAELAAEALMRLHDSIPLALEELLDRLAAQVAAWPTTFARRRQATEIDREAHKLLKANRLVEATQRATELHELILSTSVPTTPLAPEEPPPPPREAPVPPMPPPPTDRIPSWKAERIDRPAPIPRLTSTTSPVPAPPRSPPDAPRPTPTSARPPAEPPRPAAAAAPPLPESSRPGPTPARPPMGAPRPGVMPARPPPESLRPASAPARSAPTSARPVSGAPVTGHAEAAAPAQGADTVRNLVAQARELATRIQGLPRDSDLARGAAVEIRNATELLRERKMGEAERTLADLKHRLDQALLENNR